MVDLYASHLVTIVCVGCCKPTNRSGKRGKPAPSAVSVALKHR